MMTTRLMNVLVALLLVAGQLAGGVHVASHVAPEPSFAHGSAAHSEHYHQAFEHVGHLHAHAHSRPAAITGALQNTPPDKAHNASDCVLCHLATSLLVIVTNGSSLPQTLAMRATPALAAQAAPVQTYIFANTIRGPPRLSLI